MAKLKATPKNFAEALDFLHVSGVRDCSVRLGNNTYLECFTDGAQIDLIAVRLHGTHIVKFYPDGRVMLHTGGYYTVTTKERINQFISGRVYQESHKWFYVGHNSAGELDWGNPIEFTEGMNVMGGTEHEHRPHNPDVMQTICETCGVEMDLR